MVGRYLLLVNIGANVDVKNLLQQERSVNYTGTQSFYKQCLLLVGLRTFGWFKRAVLNLSGK